MNFYGMLDLADLAAWRETLMIHARGFIFSQRRKGRKGISTEYLQKIMN